MAAQLNRLLSGSEGSAERRWFGLWSLGLFILFLPPWWIWGADLALIALKPVASLLVRLVGLTGQITVTPDGGWAVGAPLTQSGQPIHYPLDQNLLKKFLLSVPLTAAFLLAPPRPTRPLRVLALCLVVLILVFVASVCTQVWGDLAAILNPELATARFSHAGTLDQPPLHPILSQIALVGRYLASTIAPLLVAILLWASLNPKGRALLMDDETLNSGTVKTD